jgi:hypothetical protein
VARRPPRRRALMPDVRAGCTRIRSGFDVRTAIAHVIRRQGCIRPPPRRLVTFARGPAVSFKISTPGRLV